MSITRFEGPDAGETRAPAGGVPVSVEERLAALRDLIATADTGGDVIHLAVTPTLRAALDGVSVPTEPEAPDPESASQPVPAPEPRRFPIQKADSVPWAIAQRAYEGYAAQNGTRQSLERLAERGGFGVEEMDEYLPGWRDLAWPVPAPEPSARLDVEQAIRDYLTPLSVVPPKTVADGMEWPARCWDCGLVTEDPDAYHGPDAEEDPEYPCPVTGEIHHWRNVGDGLIRFFYPADLAAALAATPQDPKENR